MANKKSKNSHIAGGRDAAAEKIILLLALSAFAALFYALLPDPIAATQNVDGLDDGERPSTAEVATQDMIDFAVGALKSASEYTVYAERGITEKGTAEIRGTKGDARRSESRKSTKELSNSIDAFRQLPCGEIKGGNLTGRTFAPGVYCLDSAELNGEMIIDGQGSAAGTYIFRVAGSLNAKNGSSIRLENGAQGGNVFFVAGDVEIGNDVAFRANVLSGGDIKVSNGSIVTDKVVSLGKVELDNSALLGGTTGSMKICAEQQVPVSAANDISNRIFHYVITGASTVGTAGNPIRVAIGTCSESFDLTAGPQTVTELNTGSLIDPVNGTFEGNFELIDVTNVTPASPSTRGLVNLAMRTVSVNIAAGGIPEQITLRFTNRRAITGFVEICKRAAIGPRNSNPTGSGPLSGGDPDVTGFFHYTISGVYSVNQQNPNIKTLQIFAIPVGQCTGPIAVTKGEPAPSGSNASLASVSELPRPGAYFERTEIIPSDRRNQPDVRGSVVGVNNAGADVVIPAAGGGYVEVLVIESPLQNSQTLIVFRNRSNPSRVKVCKIAGPGIPINTLFRFTVTGSGQLNAAHPQSADFGQVMRTVDVRAGDPAQGGTCEFVPGFGSPAPGWSPHQTFLNGTPVTVVEEGISPVNTVEQNPGQLRTANIRIFGSAFASGDIAGFSPNPDLTPVNGRVSRAVVIARGTITEVEFIGFRFNPTVLKICKIGVPHGPVGNPVGVTFNFRLDLVSPQIGGPSPGPMFPAWSRNVSVVAGPATSTEGNCSFVNGSALSGAAFNQGSTIAITEADDPNTRLTGAQCPSCGPGGFTANLATQTATLSGPNGLMPGINSVVFTNTDHGPICRSAGHSLQDEKVGSEQAISAPSCSRYVRFDFDGDRKADPSVFTPSTGVWSVMTSASNNPIVTRGFGENGDRPVTADYDGDGITDFAVWRPSNGRWYFQGSTNIFEYHQWGEPGDIPLTGDYNGDGKADFFIFRPTNGTWYIKTTSGQISIFQFGIPTDKVFTADFDGDGRTDVAAFRNGTWYTLQSTHGFRITEFGYFSDIPVPGDYDGDGAADHAVFRNGTWYMLSATSYTVRTHGQSGDIPVPADYDGDGKYDLAVFRASEGRWLIRRSSLSEPSPIPIILGGPGDIAIPSPYWLLP